ncbi:Pycsar system effector family protein [Actinoplanes sp. NPDC051343]|uniref:Pycsar system effector family protein n=1 Tax=Actinoplanes sp. NPDC051343 TaxID=3363906 RepID=UPI00378ED497
MTTVEFPEALAEVQTQIGRADTKASILSGLSLAALTGGTALASQAHLHGAAVVTRVMAATFVLGALVQLGLAIRPDLRGDHGFIRWAQTTTDHELYDLLTLHEHFLDQRHDQLTRVALLSRSARTKYRRIRLAVDLLGAALACAALTALLTAVGW